MGMYDTVIVNNFKLKQPTELVKFLKENNINFPHDFQTKDLENFLLKYEIDKNGQVYEFTYEKTGKKIKRKRIPFNINSNLSFIEKCIQKFRTRKFSKYLKENVFSDETKEVKKKSNLTQTFNIYTYLKKDEGKIVDLEYKIITVNGKVKNSVLIKCEIESDIDYSSRLKREKEWENERLKEKEKREKIINTWYYPILKETLNPLLYVSRISVQYVCNKLISASYKWHGV